MYLETESGGIINLSNMTHIQVKESFLPDDTSSHVVWAFFGAPNTKVKLYNQTESECQGYTRRLRDQLLSGANPRLLRHEWLISPAERPIEKPAEQTTEGFFTYTDRNGHQQTVELDVTAVLDARRCGVSWSHSNKGVTMRKRFGVVCTARRFQEIRESLEWWLAVKAYAEDNNLMNEEFLLDCLPKNRKWRYDHEQVENR